MLIYLPKTKAVQRQISRGKIFLVTKMVTSLFDKKNLAHIASFLAFTQSSGGWRLAFCKASA